MKQVVHPRYKQIKLGIPDGRRLKWCATKTLIEKKTITIVINESKMI